MGEGAALQSDRQHAVMGDPNAARTLPADAEGWLNRALELERDGHPAASLEACRRAIALWPDIAPAYGLQLRLVQQQDDPHAHIGALRALLTTWPDDPMLNSRLGAALSREGQFAAALPFLRKAAPILQHENDTLWNYTTALAASGGYHELLAAEPLLDRLAEGYAGVYPPFAHLAAAKLSLACDREAAVAAVAKQESSSAWLRTETVLGRIGKAIATREPFTLLRLDYALARYCCSISPSAHRMLRPQELSAVLDSVWESWFGAPAENLGVLFLSRLELLFIDAIRSADVIGLPGAEQLRGEHYHFGFLAEMWKSLSSQNRQAFADHQIASLMHESVPFLRPLLSGLPFLGIIGPHPTLATRLGHFCGVGEMRAIMVPNEASRSLSDGPPMAGFLPERHQKVLDEIAVPFPGAVFLVSAPGPLGIAYCGRIKALGGIGVDIGALADGWATQ